jgi:hypothetical protein
VNNNQNTRVALRRYLAWVGGGQRESQLPKKWKGIHRYAQKFDYVEVTRIGGDWLINQTGRKP